MFFLVAVGKRALPCARARKTTAGAQTIRRPQNRNWSQICTADHCCGVGRSGIYGISVWSTRSFDLVGVFMGYHGTCDIFCRIWDSDGSLCLLRIDKTGMKEVIKSHNIPETNIPHWKSNLFGSLVTADVKARTIVIKKKDRPEKTLKINSVNGMNFAFCWWTPKFVSVELSYVGRKYPKERESFENFRKCQCDRRVWKTLNVYGKRHGKSWNQFKRSKERQPWVKL